MAGDQNASLFGHGCFKPNQAKCTFGTGAFFLVNIGADNLIKLDDAKDAEIGILKKCPETKLLKTIAFTLADGTTHYALEGSIFIAGSGINWLKNSLEFFESVVETEVLARSLSEEDMLGLYLVPAFTGLGAPYWDMNARASVLGMSLDTGKAHLVRAMLEAVAYQVKDLISSLNLKETAAQQYHENGGNGVEQWSLKDFILNVDGGLAVNNFLMEFMAGILGVRVNRNENLELTALGIVMMAANALGDYDLDELLLVHKSKLETFTEAYSYEKTDRLYTGWQRAILSVRTFSGGL